MTITAAGGGQRLVVDGVGNGNFPSLTVTAGQMLVICILGYRNGTALTYAAGDITKGSGTATIGTVALDRSGTIDTGGGEYVGGGIYSVLVTGSGSLVLAYSGNSTYFYGYADIYGGAFDSSRLEAGNHASSATDGTTSADSGNATTAGAGLFVASFAPFSSTGSYTMTPDAAFTSVDSEADFANHMGGSIIRRIVSSGTTDSGSWTIGSTNGGWFAALAAYKETDATAYSITADEATYTLTAQDALLVAPKNIVADQSTFTLSAQAATLTWSWGEYFTVTTADANTTSGESIFGGLTISNGSLVILPNLIGGIAATWETANGNATGRVTLASALADPVAVSIPYYNGTTWSTIDVTFIDQGDVTTTITSDYAAFTLTAQDANLVATRVVAADQSTFTLTAQDAALAQTARAIAADYAAFTLSAQAANLIASGSYTPDDSSCNQGNQQGAFRALALTTLDYNGDFVAAMRADLADDSGSINELMIRWLQQKLGSSNQSLPGLMAEAANDRGVSRWSEITNPLAIGS